MTTIFIIFIIIGAVLLVFSALLFIRLRARALLHLDVLQNHGYFAIYFGKLNLFAGKLHAEGTNLMFTLKNGKARELHLNMKKDDRRSVSRYIREPLFCKIRVDKIDFYFAGGKAGDAFFTVMAAGMAQAAYNSAAAYLLNRRPETRLKGDVEADFYSDRLTLSASGIFSAGIADIISGFLASVILHMRESAAKKRKRRNRK